MSKPIVVVKVGSSSVVHPDGQINVGAVEKLCAEVNAVQESGRHVVIVTSGAIAAGLPMLGKGGNGRPRDEALLRAASAVGQPSLMRAFESALANHGLLGAQILLAPTDFMIRRRYLKSRGTLLALLDLGVVPVINENDAVADDEIRFGDNDRLSALVAHLIEADRLVLLTDTAGLFTADPRTDQSASLIEEIVEIDQQLVDAAGGAGTSQSTGGMASKLAAAKIATWSGVETVIASASRDNVLVDAVDGASGVGTRFHRREGRMAARKLWIAFALPASGRIIVDAGARIALIDGQRSLLPKGVVGLEGRFVEDDAVEIADEAGAIFAKGRVCWTSRDLEDHLGKHTSELPSALVHEVVHRDDLVVVPTTVLES